MPWELGAFLPLGGTPKFWPQLGFWGLLLAAPPRTPSLLGGMAGAIRQLGLQRPLHAFLLGQAGGKKHGLSPTAVGLSVRAGEGHRDLAGAASSGLSVFTFYSLTG